jgi:hypothetical protein
MSRNIDTEDSMRLLRDGIRSSPKIRSDLDVD